MLHAPVSVVQQNNLKHKRSIVNAHKFRTLSVPKSKEEIIEFKNIGPKPKPFTLSKGQDYDVYSACAAIALRGGCGGLVHGYTAKVIPQDLSSYAVFSKLGKQLQESGDVEGLPRPEEMLELYDFESSASCKKVREAVAILDLDIKVFPCPKGGKTWRPKVQELGGKLQFPFLVDKNTGKSIYGGDQIVKYLFETYGDGKVPQSLQPGCKLTGTCMAVILLRLGRGSRAVRLKKDPATLKPITFWGYELSPFSTLVREVLSELELPYVQITLARGSPKRIEFFEKHGCFQVPYIEDPNEGVSMFESAAIIKYLFDTYSALPPKSKDFSKKGGRA